MNGSIMKIAGEDALRQNIAETKRYIAEHGGGGDGGVWTTPVSCLVGDTTATITDTAIQTTSIIDAYSETSSGVPLSYKSIQVSAGQCVITFDALTEATNIRLKVTNL